MEANQILLQVNIEGINNRSIVQVLNDGSNLENKCIVYYNELSTEEKSIYDNFINLMNSKLNG